MAIDQVFSTAGTFAARRSDPETFRQLMNHADLSQWPRYVGADQSRLREAVARILG